MMRRVAEVFWQELRVIARDRGALLMLGVMPILYAIFFGAVFDGVGRALVLITVDLAVVDEDDTSTSAAFLAALAENPEIESQTLMLDEAEALLRVADVAAVVRVAPGFAQAWQDDSDANAEGLVEVIVGTRRAAEASLVRALVTRTLMQRVQDELRDPQRLRSAVTREFVRAGMTEGAATEAARRLVANHGAEDPPADANRREVAATPLPFVPVTLTSRELTLDTRRPDTAYDVTLPQAVIWGLLATVAAGCTTLARERSRGTLQRLALAPVTLGEVLIGKGLATGVIALIITGALLGTAVVVFGVTADRPVMLVVAVPAVVTAGVGLSVLLASLTVNSSNAGGSSWAVLLVLAIAGGGIIPAYLMPDWLIAIGWLSPVSWMLAAFDAPIWKEAEWSGHLRVLAALLGMGLGAGLLARGVLGRQVRAL